MSAWEQRFWPKVEIGDCWLWLAAVNSRGYGQFFDGTRNVYAHRFIWQQLVGPIPDGLTIDHLCQNKRCVNPDHLEIVDRATNRRRSVHPNSRKQFCPKGHPLVQLRAKQRDCPVCFDRTWHREYLRAWRKRRMVERILTPALDQEKP